MRTLQEIKDIIQETMWRKDLSFWCVVLMHPHIKKKSIYVWRHLDEDSCMGSEYFEIFEERREYPYISSISTYRDLDTEWWTNKIHKIIWHTVTIADLLIYAEKKGIKMKIESDSFLSVKWYTTALKLDLTKNILEQSEECIRSIYEGLIEEKENPL